MEAPLALQHAIREIREAIVAGRIKPGERLVEQDLAEALGLSRGPVREALRELSRDGLVMMRPNRGAIVRSVAAEDVIEVYALRAAIGSLALRNLLGAGRATAAVIRQLEAAARRARDARDQAGLVDADLALQSVIADASGLPRVSARFAELTAEIRMFIQALGIEYGDVDEILGENERLLAAIRSGDVELADLIWRGRFSRAEREFIELIPDGPAALTRLPWLALSDGVVHGEAGSGVQSARRPASGARKSSIRPTDPAWPVIVAASDLERFGTELLRRAGATEDNAVWVASRAVASDLAGHESHGMRRLVEYVTRAETGVIDPVAVPVVAEDRGSSAVVDGRHAFGHVSLRFVTDLVVERAKAHGVAAVGLRRSDYTGRVADYAERAAASGIVMLCFVNDSGSAQDVVPPGGTEGRLATNPIGLGVPRRDSPHLVLDMATSVVARGRVSEWTDRGEPIPDEWVTPNGFLRPVGGAKGFGLALVGEALAGALSGADTVSPAGGHDDQGVFAIGIDPERFRPLDAFTAEVEAYIAYVKDVPLEPGAGPVRVPGESRAAIAAERRVHGVPVQPFTWERLGALAAGLGVDMPPRLDGRG